MLLDFDGTLAPIVDDPAAARPEPGVLDVVGSLVGRYHLVAVVSGRPAAFLGAHLPVPGVVLCGLYGMEFWRDGRAVADPALDPWLPVIAEVAAQAESEAPVGVHVERKGLAVTLHFRQATDEQSWVAAWADAAAARTGLATHAGRRNYELRPPGAADKGSAVEALATGVSAACFIGDDLGDLDAFAALDRLAGRQPPLAAVRVAVRSDESPPELLSAADVVVDGPAGVLSLLRALAER